MVIVGSDVLQRTDADAIYSAVVSIASSGAKLADKDWKTLNVLHRVSFSQRCCKQDYLHPEISIACSVCIHMRHFHAWGEHMYS